MGLIAAALVVLALVWQPPRASLRLQLHEVTDVAPKRVEAALDMGIAAFSLLVTWTARA